MSQARDVNPRRRLLNELVVQPDRPRCLDIVQAVAVQDGEAVQLTRAFRRDCAVFREVLQDFLELVAFLMAACSSRCCWSIAACYAHLKTDNVTSVRSHLLSQDLLAILPLQAVCGISKLSHQPWAPLLLGSPEPGKRVRRTSV